MTTSNVARYLQQLCNTTFEGGRLVQDDDHVIVLYDVPMWPGARSDALRQKFQSIEIDIYQCATSISGFVVIVTIVPMSTTFSVRWGILLLLLFTSVTCLVCWKCLQLSVVDVREMDLFSVAGLGQRAGCSRPGNSSGSSFDSN
jgi:hypothetical protein